MISAQKLKLVHVGRREIQLAEGAYREILRHHGGVESGKNLDDNGFKRVVDCMKSLGFWVTRKWEQTRPREPGALPTPGPAQNDRAFMGGSQPIPSGAKMVSFQRGFYHKRLNIPKLATQTRAQANAVIEALKHRVLREMKAPNTPRARPFTLDKIAAGPASSGE